MIRFLKLVLTPAAFMVLLAGCQTVQDPSIKAVDANDKTIISAFVGGPCAALPSQGADICRFQEDANVNGSWVLILPDNGSGLSGSVRVQYRDTVKVYPINSSEVFVPMRDFFGPKWKKGSYILSALAEWQYKDNEEIVRNIMAEGLGIVLVMEKGYAPMPIDSGNHNYDIKCNKYKAQYSTSGRSAFGCR